MFQFQIWKKSLDVQYHVEAVVVFLFAAIMLILSHFLLDSESKVQNQQKEVDSLTKESMTDQEQATLDDAYKKLGNYSDEYLEYLRALLGLSLLTYTYLIKDIQELVYANIRGVVVKTFTRQLMMNIACTFTVTYWFVKHFTKFADDFDSVRSEERASLVLSRMDDDSSFNIKIVLALLISIQFTRLVYTLEVSRTFGPMVKILGSMMVDVGVFLVLFVCLFFVFVGAGTLLFNELEDFEDVGKAAKTLFATCLGNFSYTTYDGLGEVSPNVGYAFLTAFLIFSMIMLLNFLIAILSNTYSILNDVKNGLYLRKVIYLRQRYDYDRYYSAMIYSTPPLNLISLCLSPFIIY